MLLDIKLRPSDGFEVCRQIREMSNVPILMLSADSAVVDKIRAFDLGADDYLVRPFDQLELMARLRALLRRRWGTGRRSGSLPWRSGDRFPVAHGPV